MSKFQLVQSMKFFVIEKYTCKNKSEKIIEKFMQ